MSDITCTICDSKNVKVIEQQIEGHYPGVGYIATIHHCIDCNMKVDVTEDNVRNEARAKGLSINHKIKKGDWLVVYTDNDLDFIGKAMLQDSKGDWFTDAGTLITAEHELEDACFFIPSACHLDFVPNSLEGAKKMYREAKI